ncbi:MAG: hypothetical protein KAW19_01530 [Candidatus Aminicenantes bacterium]|nr:hypothetical protein [Candidatus Aminicenantes bacterium]
MKRCLSIVLFMWAIACFIYIPFAYSQDKQANIEELDDQVNLEELKEKAPRVFIDCRRCDINYIKTEITFVNYVRDRKEADVHVLITTQRTGSGGTEHTIAFIGLRDYADIQNTLTYTSNQTDTADDVRRGLVRVLKMGLVQYAAKTPIADRISVSYKDIVTPTSVKDKWNFWVFSLSLNGSLDKETSESNTSIRGNFSVNRVTPDLKIRMGVNGYFREDKYETDEGMYTSSSESESFTGLIAKSINAHWSVGAWLSLSSSTYSNIKFSISPSPAIEYNLFPYSESTRRQLRFLYKIGYIYSRYREVTVFEKTSDNLFAESLSVTLELKEPWGTATASLQGSHYFHDFSKNKIEISGELSVRLFKGFSLNIESSYERIRDQLSLPLGEATWEEILLSRKELAKDYEFEISMGFSFTFGSIYSNVVNPRFGDSGFGRRRWR